MALWPKSDPNPTPSRFIQEQQVFSPSFEEQDIFDDSFRSVVQKQQTFNQLGLAENGNRQYYLEQGNFGTEGGIKDGGTKIDQPSLDDLQQSLNLFERASTTPTPVTLYREESSTPPQRKRFREEEKRQKFLERNRIAASKCRQKKKKQMVELEEQVDMMEKKNQELIDIFKNLQEELYALKNEILNHRDRGCEVKEK